METFPATPFFDSIIDDFGIWRQTDGANILHEDGYLLDDAVTGFLLTLSLGRIEQSEVLWSFILKSQIGNGFLATADQSRNFSDNVASEDTVGKIIWAAGYALSKNFHSTEAAQLIAKYSPYLEKTKSVRGYAYILLGFLYINKELAASYFDKLKSFFDNVDEDWLWPETILKSDGAIVQYAFLRYALVFDNKESGQIGRKLLLFFEKRCTYERQRGPIGDKGWLPKGVEVAPIYSQRPADAAYMLWAWHLMCFKSNDSFDMERRDSWVQWFEGNNIIRAKMYDPSDMHSFDGIETWGVNYKSSAQSNIYLLLSKYMLAENITI